jgi:hypothetical protein
MDTKAKQPKKYSYNEKIFKRAKNDTPIIIWKQILVMYTCNKMPIIKHSNNSNRTRE